jgi:hypothetical protein
LSNLPIQISAGFMLVFFKVVLPASSKLPTHTGPLLLQLKDRFYTLVLCLFIAVRHNFTARDLLYILIYLVRNYLFVLFMPLVFVILL